MTPVARVLDAAEIAVGLRAELERDITAEDVAAFAETSGDWNPLHTDAEYARATHLEAPIVHGAFQVGLASALVGMRLPGRRVLLGSVQARFPAPLPVPCRVVVGGEITSWDPGAGTGTVKVVVREAKSRVPSAEVFLGFTLHRERAAEPVAAPPAVRADTAAPVLVVTGASGGLGAALATRLAGEYAVLALAHQRPLPDAAARHPAIREVRADLAGEDWSAPIEAALDGRPLFGIVHAAWPGAPRGGLLAAPDDTIEEQVRFGSVYAVRLARFLFARADAAGGRLVVVGSSFGARRPNLGLAPYSLGKAALESTVRLLAPEMARKRITVNAVSPAVLSVGMNRNQGEHWVRLKASRVPLGRLCQPDDVVDVVRFLLSPGAAFVSGETIELAGGEL